MAHDTSSSSDPVPLRHMRWILLGILLISATVAFTITGTGQVTAVGLHTESPPQSPIDPSPLPAPEPVILRVTPSQGVNTMVVPVNIYGQNFRKGEKVYIQYSKDQTEGPGGSTERPIILLRSDYINPTHIFAKVPAQYQGEPLEAGYYDVGIQFEDQTSARKEKAYHVVEPQAVDDLYAEPYHVWISPSPPKVGKASEIGIRVNRLGGHGGTGPFKVAFYLNEIAEEKLIGRAEVLGISPNSAADSSVVFWTPDAGGNEKLIAVIDATDEVPESNEDNNVVVRTVNVHRPIVNDTYPPRISNLQANGGVNEVNDLNLALTADLIDEQDPLNPHAPVSGPRRIYYVELHWYGSIENDVGSWIPVNWTEWLPYDDDPDDFILHPTPGLRYLQAWGADGAGDEKARTTTTTDGNGNFVVQLNAAIQGNDRVQILPQDETPLETIVTPLTAFMDKATDQMTGTGPAGETLSLGVNAYRNNNWVLHNAQVLVNGEGTYGHSFAGTFDVRAGDFGWITHSRGNFTTYLSVRAPGFYVMANSSTVGGMGLAPGRTLRVQVYDGDNTVLAEGQGTTSGYGDVYIYSLTGCATGPIQFQAGHRVAFQLDGSVPVTVTVPSLSLAVDNAQDQVRGNGPADAKLSSLLSKWQGGGMAIRQDDLRIGSDGGFVVDYSEQGDIEAGDSVEVIYYTGSDEEVRFSAYAPGLIAANLTWDSLTITGPARQTAQVVLRNALGAIKAQNTVALDGAGQAYHTLVDGAGNTVNVVAGDQIEVRGAGLDEAYTLADLTAIADRVNRTVTGKAPPHAQIYVAISYGNPSQTVTADADGNYTAQFDRMTGGYGVDVSYRDGPGRETMLRLYAPQFTIRPGKDHATVHGYAVPNQTVAISIRDSGGAIKRQQATTTNPYGWYWLYLGDVSVESGDRVSMQSGPIGTDFTVVPMSIQADPATDVVSGQTVANGWLNVYASRYFHGHSWYYYRSFSADSTGEFSTDFGGIDLWPGDSTYAIYWEGGIGDRQEVRRYIPHLWLDLGNHSVRGAAVPDGVGTLTLQDAAGNLRAETSAYASSDGYLWNHYFKDEQGQVIPLRTGDRIELAMGNLVLNATVPNLNTAIDVSHSQSQGQGPPDSTIYASAYHWRDAWYSTWTDSGSLTDVVETDANGAYQADFHCRATLARGYYAFFTEPGNYKVVVEAGGFFRHESPVLTVVDEPVHYDVPLEPWPAIYLPATYR